MGGSQSNAGYFESDRSNESDEEGRTHLDDGARLLALLTTLLGLALVRRDDGNTGELVRHDCYSSGLMR